VTAAFEGRSFAEAAAFDGLDCGDATFTD